MSDRNINAGKAAPTETSAKVSKNDLPEVTVLSSDISPKGIQVDADEGHEAILQAIAANGTDYIFYNGGTDIYCFVEGIAKAKALGRPTPEIITCLHESAAMAMAHGHFMVSRKPQVVMVHVDVGTQQVGGALHNAWRGQAGIIFMAGMYNKDGMIMLDQTLDMAGIVRGYTKWEFEFYTHENIGKVMHRAYRIANSEPCGPVYLKMPGEVLKAPMNGTTIYSPDHYAPAVSPGGDPVALQEAARCLVEAERPLVIADTMGRHPEAVGALVKLAEKLALPVSSGRTMNFPTTHPLYVSNSNPFIQNADVILLIDANSPNGAPEECRIISLDIDPIKLANPLWHGRVNIPIHCDSSKAIPVLIDLVDDFIGESQRKKIRERQKAVEAKYEEVKGIMTAAIETASTQVPISLTWLCHCIHQIVDENTILTADLVASGMNQADNAQPGSHFSEPGIYLGWAVPAAIGAKLAAPDKTVIAATGDGGFNFCVPNACLWAARRYKTPFLTVIANNSSYLAIRSTVRRYYPNGYAVQSGDFNGADLDPMVDFALLAQSCGAYGETVTDPAMLSGALQRGLDAVHSGQSAVIDVHISLERRFIPNISGL